MMKTIANVYMLAALWVFKVLFKDTSLPNLYFKLASKRDVTVGAFRKLERTIIKVTEKKLDELYFEKCLDLNLCPSFLEFKPPKLPAYKTSNTKELHMKAVQYQLNEIKRETAKAVEMYCTTWLPIKAQLTCVESYCMFSLINKHAQKACAAKIERHNKKLFNLWRNKNSRSPECIHNFSDKQITLDERNALHRGLKHHILPKRVNSHDVKCNIENTVDKLCKITNTQTDLDFRDQVKILTTSFLKKSALECKQRSNRSLHRVLNSLKKDKSIKVCKLDKGNGVAIMQTEDYYRKLDKIVLDGTKFESMEFDVNCDDLIQCKSAPWFKKEESIKYYIRTYLDAIVYDSRYLMPTGSGPGRLYGMAKVHKTGCPLRPVNSMLGTAEYNLAKWLDGIIKLHIPNEYTVNSTKNFIDNFRDVSLNDGDFCVSFDVESLFTNVPLSEVINDICDYLFDNHKHYFLPSGPLKRNQKRMSKRTLKKLLHLCTEGMFLYNSKLYKQVDGVAMGSPLGPTLANWYMGTIEKKLFAKYLPFYPKYYVRYVDDVFAIFNCESDRDQFFDLLNKQHKNLRFTMEIANGTLPFLDVEINIQQENTSTWVYRKSTYTGVLLNFNAIAPLKWKRALISCLLHRASVVCSSDYFFKCEVEKLKTIFLNNNYPLRFFNSVLSKFLLARDQSRPDLPAEDEQPEAEVYLRIPYMGSLSLQFGKRLVGLFHTKFDITVKVAFYTFKVGNYFTLKDPVTPLFRSNVVYQYTCPCDRGTTYLGMTTRQLFVRIGDHLDRTKNSAVTSHLAQCRICRDTIPKHRNFKIVTKCRSERETEIKEAMLIRKCKPSLNVQMGTFQGCSFLLRVFR